MDPSNGASIKLEVFIRDISGADRKITTWNLKGGGSRWTMEPIKPEWVRKNSENKLIFKADIDAGSLDIKNVVVFYQRYIS
jgi:protein gp37